MKTGEEILRRYHGGVYYLKVPRGYVVIEPPVETVAVKEISPVVPLKQSVGEKVSVTVPLPNVRSGPDLDFPVIHQVREGDLLTIHGYAPD